MQRQYLNYFLTVVIISVVAAAHNPASAKTKAPSIAAPGIDTMRKQLYAGELDTVFEQCTQVISDNIELPEHHLLRSLCRLYHEPQPAAQAAGGAARLGLRRFPLDANILSAKAFSLVIQSDQVEAHRFISRALKSNPKSAFAYAVLASCDSANKKKAQLLALQYGPNLPEVNFVLYKTHQWQGDEHAAIKDLSRWISANPEQALPRFMRASMQMDSNLADAALVDLSNTIKLNGKYKSAYHKRGRIYFDRTNYRAAIADWNCFEKLGGKSSGIFSRRAVCHQKLNEYRLSIEDYGKAIEASKQDGTERDRVKFMVSRAELLMQIGDYANAESQSHTIHVLDSSNVAALNIMQGVAIKRRDWQTALMALSKLIALDSDVSEWYSLRANVYRKLGKPRNAELDLHRAATIQKKGTL